VIIIKKGKHDQTAKKRRLGVPALVLIDVLCIGIGLNVFSLFHHVLHFNTQTNAVVLTTLPPQPEKTSAPVQASETDEPAEETPLTWRDIFADKFTDGEVISSEDAYRSENVSIEYTHVEENNVIYNVADIYITDVKYLRTAFGGGAYGKGSESIADMAKENNAVAAISGDHYYMRLEGLVVRNGVLYRDSRFQDVCVLLSSGEMVTMENAQLTDEYIMQAGIWQAWSFGPQLLDDGVPLTEFNSDVTTFNPRSAIGCVEPGHYFFVEVDGRIENSKGMTMTQLAELFASLGCKSAYNLDGGQSAGFAWQGKLVSYPYGRNVSDMIYIADRIEEVG